MAANIDQLQTKKSLIDLQGHSEGDFGLEMFELSQVLSDVILVEYVDTDESGDAIERNGIYIPTNSVKSAWRKAKVILTGPEVTHSKVGDIVIFPSNLGITVANVDVTGYGLMKKGIFINEQRIFGICKFKDEN